MPTIGRTTEAGASSGTSTTFWQAVATVDSPLRYTAVTGDTITQVAVYGSGAGGDPAVGIYVYSGGVPTTRVGTVTCPISAAGPQWYTASASIALTNGVEYCAAIDWAQTTGFLAHFIDLTTGTRESVSLDTTLATPWVQNTTDAFVGIFYATVTSSAGFVATPPLVYSQAVNRAANW